MNSLFCFWKAIVKRFSLWHGNVNVYLASAEPTFCQWLHTERPFTARFFLSLALLSRSSLLFFFPFPLPAKLFLLSSSLLYYFTPGLSFPLSVFLPSLFLECVCVCVCFKQWRLSLRYSVTVSHPQKAPSLHSSISLPLLLFSQFPLLTHTH